MFEWIKSWMVEQQKSEYSVPYQPTKFPAPPEPIKERKINFEISEPVQSIIRSLEEGWWDFHFQTNKGYTIGCPACYYVFKHEWFGNEIKLKVDIKLSKPCAYELTIPRHVEEWMTPREKHVVAKLCTDILNEQTKLSEKHRLEQRRESFMNLVGFDLDV